MGVPPEPTRETCRGCGAGFKGLICEYCGLASPRAEDPAVEREALDEFQLLLGRCELEPRAKLLREGFLPSTAPNLLEAGVRCLQFLDESAEEPAASAMRRLDAIVAKLAALPSSGELTRAIAHYQARIDAHRRAERATMVSGFVLVGSVLLAVVAGLIWLLSKVFSR